MNIVIRNASAQDLQPLTTNFAAYHWPCSLDQLESYWFEIQEHQRVMWIAYDTLTQTYVGYVTLVWNSQYKPFFTHHIPEIKDLNVVPSYRKQGIGSTLLDYAEQEAFKKSTIVGIGVGLTADYGPAQRLYIKRGFVPDGNGLTNYYESLSYGRMAMADGLTLWLTKLNTLT